MKKIAALLVALTLVFGLCACSASAGQAQVMTSFYPIYILALNVFDGIDSIRVDCMTAPQTGCLHDYQLLVNDMMKLSKADALIVCGAGMEGYLDDVKGQFSDLKIVDCSKNIELIPADEHQAHGHEHFNAHTWLDAQNAIQIVKTISDAGCEMFPGEAEKIIANATAYVSRLEALDAKLKALLAPINGKSIVTFHEAFAYFAKAYGIEIAAVITEDHDDALSPTEIAKVINNVKEAGDPPLFTEPQYSSVAAETIARETGASIYVLDPLVSGEIALDVYETGMRKNAEILLNALLKN